MRENLILANAVASRRAFRLVEVTGYHQTLSDQGGGIWKLIQEWYVKDPEAEEVNLVLLRERVRQTYNGQNVTMMESIIDSFDGQASAENFAEVLLEGRREVLRQSMIMHLADKKDGDFYDLFRQFEELEDMAMPDIATMVGTDPSKLVEVVADGDCIPLATPQLNACLRGGVLPGSHTMVFGRPEIGKSLFAINCLATAAKAGYRVAIWENEDSIVVTQLRAAQAFLGATEEELREVTPSMKKRLQQAGWDRCFFHDSSGGTLAEIEAWIKGNRIDFCVINQLANLTIKTSDNRVLELGALSRGARAIGKSTGCAMLTVHQAGDSADGRRVLRMGDLEWSNTAIQATLDVLIGFGADDDLDIQNRRMLSLPKNKRGGTHDKILVSMDLERGTLS